jgi:hypothetical protein
VDGDDPDFPCKRAHVHLHRDHDGPARRHPFPLGARLSPALADTGRREYDQPVKIARILAAIAVAGGIGAAAGTASARAPLPVNTVSRNWAGYAVTHARGDRLFTSVTATWTQPRVTCGRGDAGQRAAIWVGLGGYRPGSNGLEQAGVSSDCGLWSNRPHYYAWYEIPPYAGVVLESFRVDAGDAMTAKVSVNRARTLVFFNLRNRTRGWVFVKAVAVREPNLTSAEWIVEPPIRCDSSHCGVPGLANFGTVRLADVFTVGNGHLGTILDRRWHATAIRLAPSRVHAALTGSTAGAAPGALSPAGDGFSVAWQPHAVFAGPKPKPLNPLFAGPYVAAE